MLWLVAVVDTGGCGVVVIVVVVVVVVAGAAAGTVAVGTIGVLLVTL